MITRYSSRRQSLGRFLSDLLPGATRYDRIAGYFRSSMLEVAGDALELMAGGACARVICNSDLHPLDVVTARAAKNAMYREWCRDLPEDISPTMQARLEILFDDFTGEVYQGLHHLNPSHQAEPARVAAAWRALWARASA